MLLFTLFVDLLEQIEKIVGDGFACDVVEHAPKLVSDDALASLKFALFFRAQVLSPPPLRDWAVSVSERGSSDSGFLS